MRVLNEQNLGLLRPEMRHGVFACEYVMNKYGEELTITWIRGGKHKEGSLHAKRRAIDGLLPGVRQAEIFGEIKDLIGPEYDLVIEEDHFHLEWDPK